MIIALASVLAFTILGIITLLKLNGRDIPLVLSAVLFMLVSYILGIEVPLPLLLKHWGMS